MLLHPLEQRSGLKRSKAMIGLIANICKCGRLHVYGFGHAGNPLSVKYGDYSGCPACAHINDNRGCNCDFCFEPERRKAKRR
jgi:hypothetical protein